MLSIIFLILKILGILLLIFLLLILFFAAVVLFVPVRYRLTASRYEKLKGELLVSWLLRGISLRVFYDGRALARGKVLWFRLFEKQLWPFEEEEAGGEAEAHPDAANLDKVLLFVTAIAIHNLPEGIAAGVSFGSDNQAEALLIAGGIALQNIPEGMVIIAPMLAAGISARRTLIIATATGLVEVVGTLLGYLAVSAASAILPFALAFAGGTMLYVISDEMIPETHAHGAQSGATYALLVGFCIMLLSDALLA